jgi:uncharacterized membrane protein YeaQ/YmgE (transglycosylase-associated protein family)
VKAQGRKALRKIVPEPVGVSELLGTYSFLGWILIGLIAGGVARLIMPGKQRGGCLITMLLGIAGALLMGFIGNTLGWYTQGQAGGFVAATLGAILIIFVYEQIQRRRT